MSSFAFGDVFQYNDQEYIFLQEIEDTLYAARILNQSLTDRLNRRVEVVASKNSSIITGLTYSFVILQTKELKERAAHFANTGKDTFNNAAFVPLSIKLCKEDLQGIRDEIIKKGCVSIRLKEEVKKIKI